MRRRWWGSRLLAAGALLSVVLTLWLGRLPGVDDAVSSLARQQPAAVPRTMRLPRALRDALTLARQVARYQKELNAAQQRQALAALHADLRLHGVDTQLYTAWNAPITLKAINWYGFEYPPFVPDGLDKAPLDSILVGLRRLGFNALRLTFADETVEANPVVTSGLDANPGLRGLHSLDIMQRLIERAGHAGLRVILCNSRSEAGRGPEITSGTWFTARYPESAWMADWITLVKRFRRDSALVGADLRNEPHVVTTGSSDRNPYLDDGPLWGQYQGQYYHGLDWHYAAQTLGNLLLGVDPRILIIVEGVQMYVPPQTSQLTAALWGSNLIGVQYDQVQLSRPSQLVYSVHEYGPQMWEGDWFSPRTTYQSLAKRWDTYWGYLLSAPRFMRAPIFVGEFGTCDDYFSCVSSAQGWKQGFWFQSFVRYLHAHPQVGWAYWALNPTGPFAPGAVDFYSLVSQDWRHYYPLLTHGLAPLLSEPDGVWQSPAATAGVTGFAPRPGCFANRSCLSGPETARVQPAAVLAIRVTANVPYVTPADPNRVGDLYRPEATAGRHPALRPAVVIVHGRTWSRGGKTAATGALARDLARHGYVAFDINYRLTGEGGAFPADIEDVKDAAAFLAANATRFGIDATRIGLVGSGAGGYLATMAAYTPDVAPFVAPHYPHTRLRIAAVGSFFAPTDLSQLARKDVDPAEIADLQAYLGVSYQQQPNRYLRASPATYTPTAVPTIFFQGRDDPDAPFARTFRLYRYLRQWSHDAQLIDLPGAPHGLGALRGAARQVIVSQLESFLDGVFHQKAG